MFDGNSIGIFEDTYTQLVAFSSVLDAAAKLNDLEQLPEYQQRLLAAFKKLHEKNLPPQIIFDHNHIKAHLRSGLARVLYLEYLINCIDTYGKNYLPEDDVFPIFLRLMEYPEIKQSLSRGISFPSEIKGQGYLFVLARKGYEQIAEEVIRRTNIKLNVTWEIPNSNITMTNMYAICQCGYSNVFKLMLENKVLVDELLNDFKINILKSDILTCLRTSLEDPKLSQSARQTNIFSLLRAITLVRKFPAEEAFRLKENLADYIYLLKYGVKQELVLQIMKYVSQLVANQGYTQESVEEAKWLSELALAIFVSDKWKSQESTATTMLIEKWTKLQDYFNYFLSYFTNSNYEEKLASFFEDPLSVCCRPLLEETVNRVAEDKLTFDYAIALIDYMKQLMHSQSDSIKKAFLDAVANLWHLNIQKNAGNHVDWHNYFNIVLNKTTNKNPVTQLRDLTIVYPEMTPVINYGPAKGKHYATIGAQGKCLPTLQLLDKHKLFFLYEKGTFSQDWPLFVAARLDFVEFLVFLQESKKINLRNFVRTNPEIACDLFTIALYHRSFKVLHELSVKMDLVAAMAYSRDHSKKLPGLEDQITDWGNYELSNLLIKNLEIDKAIDFIYFIADLMIVAPPQFIDLTLQRFYQYIEFIFEYYNGANGANRLLELMELVRITLVAYREASKKLPPDDKFLPLKMVADDTIQKMVQAVKCFEDLQKKLPVYQDYIITWAYDKNGIVLTVRNDFYKKFLEVLLPKARKNLKILSEQDDQITFLCAIDDRFFDKLHSAKVNLNTIALPPKDAGGISSAPHTENKKTAAKPFYNWYERAKDELSNVSPTIKPLAEYNKITYWRPPTKLQLEPWLNIDETERQPIVAKPQQKAVNTKPSKQEAAVKSNNNNKSYKNTQLFAKPKKITRLESASVSEQDIFSAGLHHYQMTSSLFSEHMTINAKKTAVFRYAIFFSVIRSLEIIGLNGYYSGKTALSVDDRLAILIRDQLVHHCHNIDNVKLTTLASNLLEYVLPRFQKNNQNTIGIIDFSSDSFCELLPAVDLNETLTPQQAASRILQIIQETVDLTKVIADRSDVNNRPHYTEAMKGCLVMISELYTQFISGAAKHPPKIFIDTLPKMRNRLVHVIGESNDKKIDNSVEKQPENVFWLHEEVSLHDIYDMIKLLQDEKIKNFLQKMEKIPSTGNINHQTPTLGK